MGNVIRYKVLDVMTSGTQGITHIFADWLLYLDNIAKGIWEKASAILRLLNIHAIIK